MNLKIALMFSTFLWLILCCYLSIKNPHESIKEEINTEIEIKTVMSFQNWRRVKAFILRQNVFFLFLLSCFTKNINNFSKTHITGFIGCKNNIRQSFLINHVKNITIKLIFFKNQFQVCLTSSIGVFCWRKFFLKQKKKNFFVCLQTLPFFINISNSMDRTLTFLNNWVAKMLGNYLVESPLTKNQY